MKMTRWGLIPLVALSLMMNACSSEDGSVKPVNRASPSDPWGSPESEDGGGFDEKTACEAGTFDGSELSGIIGGSIASTSGWVARKTFMIMADGKDGASMCTATLIDRDVILTAAHCVEGVKSADSIVAIFSAQPECDNSRMELVSKVIPAAAYKIHEGYGKGSMLDGRNDLALVRLSRSAPSSYETVELKSSGREWNSYDRILSAGYGRSVGGKAQETRPTMLRAIVRKPLQGKTLEDVKERLRKTLFPKESLLVVNTVMAMLFDTSPDAESLWVDQTDRRGICQGDSGGPAYVMEDGKVKQIGVASIVLQDDPGISCMMTSAYTNVLRFKDWITSNYTEMTGRDSSFLFQP